MTLVNIHSARHRLVVLFAAGALFSLWLVTSVPPFKPPASSTSSLRRQPPPKLSSVHGMVEDPEWLAEQEQVLAGSSRTSSGIAGRIGSVWDSVGDRLRPYVVGAAAPSGSQVDFEEGNFGDDDFEGSEIERELRRWLRVRSREVGDRCRSDGHRWEDEYGRANLRMSRSYAGSGERLKSVLKRAMLGEELKLAAIGGSVTGGHQIYKSEIWFSVFSDWLDGFLPPRKAPRLRTAEGPAAVVRWLGEDGSHSRTNGAVPATGSDYFSFCHSLHIPSDASLILVELSINDEYEHEHTENMENLLRSLLDLPSKPAVVLVQALEFNSATMANGGDIHLPVAVYYDVPVISLRNPLAAHFMRHPELIHPFFTTNYWQDPDLRHINARGHRDLANMLAAYVQDTACELVDQLSTSRRDPLEGILLPHARHNLSEADDFVEEPVQARPWGPWRPQKGDMEPEIQYGVWSAQDQHGQLPRLRFRQHWDAERANVHLEPQCFSTRSAQHPLMPTRSNGWREWHHPDRPEKTYLFANETGASFEYEIETRMGTIKMYSLRSKTFGLGSIGCVVDGDESTWVRADGYWDNGNANIGRFTTLATNLPPGRHSVRCEVLEETADPGGGHEFRIISLMSL